MKRNSVINNSLSAFALKVPYVFILLLMIIISPLGVYLFVIKVNNDKTNMYNKGRSLINVGIFITFLIGIGIYSKIKEIIQLYDSGMSFDMMNFLPDNAWLYLIGIIIMISYIYAGKKILKRAKIEQIYTYRINVDNETSLKKIKEELQLSMLDVKKDINSLQKKGFLVSIDIDNKKKEIVYKDKKDSKVIIDKILKTKRLKCSKCGTLVILKREEYIECDFCGHGMIDDNE